MDGELTRGLEDACWPCDSRGKQLHATRRERSREKQIETCQVAESWKAIGTQLQTIGTLQSRDIAISVLLFIFYIFFSFSYSSHKYSYLNINFLNL